MSADLLDWLRARLDEDERAARATVPGPWKVSHDDAHVHSPDEGLTVMENVDDPGPWLRALPAFMTRWDPARVLAEVDAKRRILDAYTTALAEHDGEEGAYDWDSEYARTTTATLGLVVRVLAAVHADHPGYRPEWAPEPAPGH